MHRRQIISVQDAAKLVNSILDTRDRCIVLLLLKTGIRLHELAELDIDDINLEDQSLTVKPTPKRSSRVVFYDEEALTTLKYWLRLREKRTKEKALFVGPGGSRLVPNTIHKMVLRYATKVGLHNPKSKKPEDRFSPHNMRHFFTTHLIRAGIPREYIKELRGDARIEAIDIYNHIDQELLKESYLAHYAKAWN
jgi:integrase/recombinase XerD